MAYLFEMHYHTPQTSPCGTVTPAQALPKYQRAGYAGVVVTDHCYKQIMDRYGNIPWPEKVDRWLAGYHAAQRAAPEGFRVLLGMEVRFEDNANDHLVYGLDEEFLKTHPDLYHMGVEAFSKLARDNGLFFAQAHPFRKVCAPRPPQLLDGVEVYNGNLRWNSHNETAYDFARKNDLVMLSGSDFHEWEDLCRGGTYLPRCPESSKELARLLRSGGELRLRQTQKPSLAQRIKTRLCGGNGTA